MQGLPRLLILGALLVSLSAIAQTLYKYRGEDGEWIYSDVPPDDGEVAETRDLASGRIKGTLDVSASDTGPGVRFYADNQFYAPVEVRLNFTELDGVRYPDPDDDLTWIVPPRSSMELTELEKLGGASAPAVFWETQYMIGDPAARHVNNMLYRVPFAISTDYRVTQAYPDVVTHRTLDSRYAVDIAMPIGTNIFAARDGVVFDVSADHFTGGTDPNRDTLTANVVQILHEDGTYAVYAHLNWNSIRVQPGQRVNRGQYIADSGNTGFSSGPHLHFAVLRNAGLETVSVPVQFEGANTTAVAPATGNMLTAH